MEKSRKKSFIDCTKISWTLHWRQHCMFVGLCFYNFMLLQYITKDKIKPILQLRHLESVLEMKDLFSSILLKEKTEKKGLFNLCKKFWPYRSIFYLFVWHFEAFVQCQHNSSTANCLQVETGSIKNTNKFSARRLFSNNTKHTQAIIYNNHT